MEPVTTAISPALNDIQGMENVFAHSAAIKGFPGETLEFFTKNRILIMTAVSALPQRDPGNWVRSAKTPISAFSPPLSAAQRCVGFVLPSWKLGSFGKNPNLDVSLLPSRRLGGAFGFCSPHLGNWVRSAKSQSRRFSPPLSAARRCVGLFSPSRNWVCSANSNLSVSLLPSLRPGGALGLFSHLGNWVRSAKSQSRRFSPPLSAARRCVWASLSGPALTLSAQNGKS